MIKFFRKIRQRLLTENKFSKYLLYAIGEIILVVIGIMIALQFNNLNEEKKKQRNIDQLIIDIEQDLLANYNAANRVLHFYRAQDSIFKRIANNTLTKEDYDNNNNLSYLTMSWEHLIPIDKNINQLVESEKIVQSQLKPIIKAAKALQHRQIVLEEIWTNLEENIDYNHSVFASFPWFVKYDSISNSQRMDFMLNDQKYQTLAMGHWARSQNFHDKVSRYRAQTIATLITIKKCRNDFNSTDIKNLLQKIGMQPFVEYSCDKDPKQLQSIKNIRASELYGNLSNDTIRISITNNKGQRVLDKMILAPNTFQPITSNEFFGIDGDNNTLVTLLDKNGNCIKKFGALENGYLLIE